MTSTSPFIAKPFSYFDIQGECNFPSPDFIRSNAQQGIVTALVLDANICLNLSNYARGQKDPVKESMLRQFLLAIELVSVDVVPYFGCLELASTRGSDQLDTDKLTSITSNVARALTQSKESLAWGHQVSTDNTDDLMLDDKSLSSVSTIESSSINLSLLRVLFKIFFELFVNSLLLKFLSTKLIMIGAT